MDRSIVDKVAALGFDVYMRDEADSYMLYTDGRAIGYLQAERFGGLSVATVHVPSRQHGTGFLIAEGVSELTADGLRSAFVLAPEWAYLRDGTVTKYRDIEHYRAASSFNAKYRMVAGGNTTSAPEASSKAEGL